MQRLDRRLAGVLEVLDGEQQGTRLADLAEQFRHRVERAPPAQLGVRRGGRPVRRHLADEVAERGALALREQVTGSGRQAQDDLAHRLGERLEVERALGARAPHHRDEAPAAPGLDAQRLAERALADPRLAGDQHQAAPAPRGRGPGPREHRELGLPADERRRFRGGGRRRLGLGDGRLRPVAQHGEEDLLRARRGVAPEVGGEVASQVLVRAEGVGVRAAALVGGHERPGGGLVQGVVGEGTGRLVDGRLEVAEVEGGGPAAGAGAGERAGDRHADRVDPVGVRRAGQGDARGQQPLGDLGAHRGEGPQPLGELALGGGHEVERLGDVDDGRVVAHQPVGPGIALDPVAAQRPAQAADQGGEVARRLRGLPVAPQEIGQHRGGQEAAVVGGEDAQEPLRLPARDRPVGHAVHPESADQPKPEGSRAHPGDRTTRGMTGVTFRSAPTVAPGATDDSGRL